MIDIFIYLTLIPLPFMAISFFRDVFGFTKEFYYIKKYGTMMFIIPRTDSDPTRGEWNREMKCRLVHLLIILNVGNKDDRRSTIRRLKMLR